MAKGKRGPFEFTCKDANRDWWKLTLKRGRLEPCDIGDDYWWDYTLVLIDPTKKGQTVWTGEVFALYDTIPSVTTVMKDFASKTSMLAVEFVSSEGVKVRREDQLR